MSVVRLFFRAWSRYVMIRKPLEKAKEI